MSTSVSQILEVDFDICFRKKNEQNGCRPPQHIFLKWMSTSAIITKVNFSIGLNKQYSTEHMNLSSKSRKNCGRNKKKNETKEVFGDTALTNIKRKHSSRSNFDFHYFQLH